MIRLVEVIKSLSGYRLEEVYINPEHVVAMRQDNRMVSVMKEGLLPEGLNSAQGFTKLYVDRGHTGIDITVVGDIRHIKEKLGINAKTLLKG